MPSVSETVANSVGALVGLLAVVAVLVAAWVALRSRLPDAAPYLGAGGIAWILAVTLALAFWQEGPLGGAVKLWSWSQVDLLDKAWDALPIRHRDFPWRLIDGWLGLLVWIAAYTIVGLVLYWAVERTLRLRLGRTMWHRAWISWSVVAVAYWLLALALWQVGVVELIE